MRPSVAVLFARADSVYKTLSGVDVFDAERDALTYPGGLPIVAHPPCRSWGRLRGLATIIPAEKALGCWAVEQVQQWGGVLEHPIYSTLWDVMELPKPGSTDRFGGWTLPIHQFWWGHRAEKRTWLYIVGCRPQNLPPIPLVLGDAPCIISTRSKRWKWISPVRPETKKSERESTPPELALWLVELARRTTRALKVSA